VVAVNDVTFDIYEGEIFGVIGYSGAGKSTLVRLINALEKTTSGSVIVDGTNISALSEARLRPIRARIGMIFQQFNLLQSRTIAGNVSYPLEVAGWPKAKREARVAELLAYVGISDKANMRPSQLSGGQRQRVGIARALATSPQILLADEATSALDPETTKDVLDLLKQVNRDLGITIVVITHAMSVVRQLCNRVAVMENGRVVELGDTYEIFTHPQQAITKRFVGTALQDRPDNDALAKLRDRHQGRLITVGVQDSDRNSAYILRTLVKHDVDAHVIHGGITDVLNRPYGSVTFELSAKDPANIDRAIAALQDVVGFEDLGGGEDAAAQPPYLETGQIPRIPAPPIFPGDILD